MYGCLGDVWIERSFFSSLRSKTLGVTSPSVGSLLAHCEHCAHHEEHASRECQDRQRLERDRSGMCIRIHFVHHVRGERQVFAGEAKDHQRRRSFVGHVNFRLRQVRRAFERIPAQIPGNCPKWETTRLDKLYSPLCSCVSPSSGVRACCNFLWAWPIIST